MTSKQVTQLETDVFSSEGGSSTTKNLSCDLQSTLAKDDSRERTTTRFFQDSMIKEEHGRKHQENSQSPSYTKQTVSSILKRNSYQSGDYKNTVVNAIRRWTPASFDILRRALRSASFDETKFQLRNQSLGVANSSRRRASLTAVNYDKRVKMSEYSVSEHEESEDYAFYEDDEDHGNILDFEAMRASVDYACDVHVPGVDPLRRSSPTLERHVEGGVSPLPILRRRSRTGRVTPFSIEVAPGDSISSSLETRPPSAPGYTSLEMRGDATRNAPTRYPLERPLPHNNSAVALTQHDPEGIAITLSDYHHLREYVHASEFIDSEDEGNETLQSLDPQSRCLSNETPHLVQAWDVSQTNSQLDSTIPPLGALAIDRNKQIVTRDRSSEIATNDARCFSGVEIVGSPPTGLVNISEGGNYEDSRSQESNHKPNVKGSIILAGLFTGIAVIVGRIFTRKKHK